MFQRHSQSNLAKRAMYLLPSFTADLLLETRYQLSEKLAASPQNVLSQIYMALHFTPGKLLKATVETVVKTANPRYPFQ